MPAYGRLMHDFCEKLGVERLRRGRQLDGRLRRRRGGDAEPALRPAGPGLGRRAHQHLAPEARADARACARMLAAGAPLRVQPQTRSFARPRARRDRLPRHLRRYPAAAAGAALGVLPGRDARRGLRRRARRRWSATTSATASSEIEMPTLIVWGRNDHVVPAAARSSYDRRIPHSRLEIFERTGHVPSSSARCASTRCSSEFLPTLAGDRALGGRAADASPRTSPSRRAS